MALHESFLPEMTHSESPNLGTKLYPFRSSKEGTVEKFWNSEMCKLTTNFGYTYPDLEDVKSRDELLRRFDAKYRWSLHGDSKQLDQKMPREMEPVDVRDAQCFNYTAFSGTAAKIPIMAQQVLSVKEQAVDMVQTVSKSATDAIISSNPPHAEPPNPADLATHGYPGIGDALANEPTGTRVILQWYIDSQVQK